MERRGPWDPAAKQRMPPTLGPALVRSGKAVACLAAFLVLKTYFPVDLLEAEQFFSAGILYR